MRVLVRDGLFTDGDPPALLGTRCAACGSVHFPRADACTYCATEDPEPIELVAPGHTVGVDRGDGAASGLSR